MLYHTTIGIYLVCLTPLFQIQSQNSALCCLVNLGNSDNSITIKNISFLWGSSSVLKSKAFLTPHAKLDKECTTSKTARLYIRTWGRGFQLTSLRALIKQATYVPSRYIIYNVCRSHAVDVKRDDPSRVSYKQKYCMHFRYKLQSVSLEATK